MVRAGKRLARGPSPQPRGEERRRDQLKFTELQEEAHGIARRKIVMGQDKPFAYVVRPHYERDQVMVFLDLERLVAQCDKYQMMQGPDYVQVMAAYMDGREVEVRREAYSVPAPASRAEAEEFIRWQSDPDGGKWRGAAGALRSNPELPFDDQVREYIDNSPWRWKTPEEITAGGSVALCWVSQDSPFSHFRQKALSDLTEGRRVSQLPQYISWWVISHRRHSRISSQPSAGFSQFSQSGFTTSSRESKASCNSPVRSEIIRSSRLNFFRKLFTTADTLLISTLILRFSAGPFASPLTCRLNCWRQVPPQYLAVIRTA